MNSIRRDGAQYALTVVRLALGLCFLWHGGHKVAGAFGLWGLDLNRFLDGAVGQGLGLPHFMGYLAALFEFGAGVSLFFGIVPELGAAMLLPVMLFAVRLHLPKGYDVTAGGFEYPFNLFWCAVAILLGGGGRLTVWNPLRPWREGRLRAVE